MDQDYEAFVAARRAGLVDMLVADGVARADAEEAVADVLVRLRHGWSGLRREQDVDRLVPELVRERAGVASAGVPAPVAARVAVVAALAIAVLVAAAWWWGRPAPPEVERADNPVPVAWYAGDRLHLAEVVVTLPAVAAFVGDGEGGAVVRDEDGRVWRVAADGEVDALDRAPEVLSRAVDPPDPSPYLRRREELRVLDVAAAPDGRLVHLVAYGAARARSGAFVRLSESGRHGLVVCDATGCGDLLAVVAEGQGLRLR